MYVSTTIQTLHTVPAITDYVLKTISVEQQTLPLEQMVQEHPPAEDVGKEKMTRFIIHIV